MSDKERYAVMLADYREVSFYMVYAGSEEEAVKKAKDTWVFEGGGKEVGMKVQKVGTARVEQVFKWEMP